MSNYLIKSFQWLQNCFIMKNLRFFLLLATFAIIASFVIYSCSKSENINNSMASDSSRTSHFSTEIGQRINGINYITTNPDLLKQNWSDFNNSSGRNFGYIDDIAIVEGEGEGLYIMRGKSNRSTSAIELVLVGDKFYERMTTSDGDYIGGDSYEITCSGCIDDEPSSAQSCAAVVQLTNLGKFGGYCTSGAAKNCTKSVTITSGSILAPSNSKN
jgi:hypothetical protein